MSEQMHAQRAAGLVGRWDNSDCPGPSPSVPVTGPVQTLLLTGTDPFPFISLIVQGLGAGPLGGQERGAWAGVLLHLAGYGTSCNVGRLAPCLAASAVGPGRPQPHQP